METQQDWRTQITFGVMGKTHQIEEAWRIRAEESLYTEHISANTLASLIIYQYQVQLGPFIQSLLWMHKKLHRKHGYTLFDKMMFSKPTQF
jgi:hypothetical protein